MHTPLHHQQHTFLPDPALPLALFQSNPDYFMTPVHKLPLGRRGTLLVKDERSRLGLSAFKALGGIYAVSQLIGKYWQEVSGQPLDPERLQSKEIREFSSGLEFVCASAGNHGLAVARGAQMFGAHARVHLARTVPEAFSIKLRAMGATVIRSGADYEESVSLAQQDAQDRKAILLADGSWPGYLEPPALVMEGYTVMAEELRNQLAAGSAWPSQVYLQAGVGGMAAAVAWMIRDNWPVQPEIVVVEPEAAPCLRESVRAGRAVRVSGPESNMGRLDCKEPSLLALEVLCRTADRFITVTDQQARNAEKELAGHDLATTPSGAAGYAGWCADADASNENRTALIIVTEGALWSSR